MLELSNQQAVSLALDALLLRQTNSDIEQTIHHLGLLQIDSVNVFERAHFMPLFSRHGNYDRSQLLELQKPIAGENPKLVEYWAHEASLIPSENLKLYKHRMDATRNGDRKNNWASWFEANQKLVAEIKAIIESEGPQTLNQIEHQENQRTGNWWGWSPVKTALEYLFIVGDLTSAGRHNFARIYALPEQVFSQRMLEEFHSQDEMSAKLQLLSHAANTLGVATVKDLVDYHRLPLTASKPLIERLIEQQVLIPTKVSGWKDQAFVTAKTMQLLNQVTANKNYKNSTMIFSPFDPLIWNRDRIKRLFDFDYQIEIYTPKPKRVYGYYTLPILHNGKLTGRIDLKSNRQTKTLEVKAAWAETWLSEKQKSNLAADLKKTLETAKQWQQLDSIHYEKVGNLEL